DETTVDKFLKENEDLQLYKKVLDDISRQRAHILSEKEEALLSEASEPLDAASNTFVMLSNADIRFLEIKDDEGEKTELTQGSYINFMESKNREVRKGAFHAMHDTIGSYINIFASTLTGNVKKDNFMAKVRDYDSARQAALDGNKIPESVYDNLVEAIND